MKCFYYLSGRYRSREQRSAPILVDKSNNSDDISADQRVTKSSCGATSPPRINQLYEEKAHDKLSVFTFSELRKATNDFSKLFKIGEGGFGSVYKGAIKPLDGKGDPVVVAVKKLDSDGYQGHKQWVAEVQFLGVLEHPNLVKLIGYCTVDGERGIQRLLVYEFMPNKSLEDHLFSRAYPPLSWQRRLRIVLGAAEGLAYLHEGLQVQVIYRDFKSSNVLLDEDFNPKLSDFGLAREGPTAGHSHVSTVVVGTYGYAAPEYIETGHLTAKSDVWSFGVVLYEILTGRRSLERNRPKSEEKLLDWVRHYPADGRKFKIIIDQRLENQYSLKAAQRTAKLADSCLSKSARDRPKMSQVVETLKQIISISGEESSSDKNSKSVEDDTDEEKQRKPLGPSESAKRRIAHLAKLSEYGGGVSRRRSMILQRAKVT